MAEGKINVNLIKVFQGVRHDRLRGLWNGWAYRHRDEFTLHWWSNPGWFGHAEALQSIWEEELRRPERFTIITEADFLPGRAFNLSHLCTPERPIVAAEYCTRDPETLDLTHHDCPGAWYLLIDKDHAPKLNFRPAGKHNDPCNDLCDKHKIWFLPQKDCLPRHYGTSMASGEHLFWSRHLHDDPELVVAGVKLGDMQHAHDNAVKEWKAAQTSTPSGVL